MTPVGETFGDITGGAPKTLPGGEMGLIRRGARYAQCRTASLETVELGMKSPQYPALVAGDTPNRRRPTHRILVSFLPAPPPRDAGAGMVCARPTRVVLTRRKCLTY